MKSRVNRTPPMTKKIAIVNVATRNLSPILITIIHILFRSTYEVHASDNVIAYLNDDLKLKVFSIPDYKNQEDGGDLLKVNVAILDPEMEFLINDTEKNVGISTKIVLEAFLVNNNTSIIVDVADYEWFIKKLSNIHGVRAKDKTWLKLKAAILFKMNPSTIVDLVNSARPLEPKSMASH